MKVIKFLSQVVAALIYTPLYTSIMYLAITIPFAWIMSLSMSWWMMLIVYIIFGGIVEGLIVLLQTIGMIPFTWIAKNNKVSFWLALGLCVILSIRNMTYVWQAFSEHGTVAIIVAIIAIGMLIQFVIGSASSLSLIHI